MFTRKLLEILNYLKILRLKVGKSLFRVRKFSIMKLLDLTQ